LRGGGISPYPLEARRLPDYSTKEIQYLGALQKKLENARNMRDTNHDEYDGMTYIEQWQASCLFVHRAEAEPEDTNYQSGIVLDNLIQILSQIVNYDMGPQIRAYDDNQLEISALGHYPHLPQERG
jgi:hypothetical protein